MTAQRELFGTDGIRGVANCHPMTSDIALALGRAAAHVFRRDKRHHAIVIGKDTRLSGYMLETALASGICSMGVDVLLVGPLPTPGVAFITRSMRGDAGVMISASHNPYQDNGIKFFDGDGFKLPDTTEAEMERLMAGTTLERDRPTAEDIGKAARVDDADGRYITFLKATVPTGITFDGMRIVVDCAHGAGYRVAPPALSELGAHVMAIGVSPDGRNINRGCGSLHPEAMIRAVKEQGAVCGIALDGDADRVIMCDEHGTIVDGDALLAISAIDLHRHQQLRHHTVVATTMSNFGLNLAMAAHGIRVLRTNVGDRYVMQAMREGNYNLGGEQSGHLIFSDYNSTGDGILGALQILTIMCRTGQPLSKLRQVMAPVPQILMNIRVREKKAFSAIPQIAQMIAGFERELGERGRILVRYSGTEAIARVMVEGEPQDRIRRMADDLANAITAQIGA